MVSIISFFRLIYSIGPSISHFFKQLENQPENYRISTHAYIKHSDVKTQFDARYDLKESDLNEKYAFLNITSQSTHNSESEMPSGTILLTSGHQLREYHPRKLWQSNLTYSSSSLDFRCKIKKIL